MVASFGEAAQDVAIHDIGVKVAALMTQEIIQRRLPRPVQADRVILPGRCRADLAALTEDFGVAFERGPEEIADLPAYLGRGGAAPRSLALRHAHFRRDRRRVEDERRGYSSRRANSPPAAPTSSISAACRTRLSIISRNRSPR